MKVFACGLCKDLPQTVFQVLDDVLVAGGAVVVRVVDDHVPDDCPVGYIAAMPPCFRRPGQALGEIGEPVAGVQVRHRGLWRTSVGGVRIRLRRSRTCRRLLTRRHQCGHNERRGRVPGGLCVDSVLGPVGPAVEVRRSVAVGHGLPASVLVLQVDHEQHGDQDQRQAKADHHSVAEFHGGSELSLRVRRRRRLRLRLA